jgi:hypothetical protein
VILAFADKQEAAKNDKAASGRKRRNRRSVFMAAAE